MKPLKASPTETLAPYSLAIEEQQQQPEESNESIPLKLTSPLLATFERKEILKESFTLSSGEETLLLEIVRESQLASCLTLFDLLFFNLHQQIEALENLVRPDDYSEAIGSLERFYGTVTVAKQEQRNLVDLNTFLKDLTASFIRSNNAKIDFSNPDAKIKASGATTLIIKTLNPRVKLIEKFLSSTAAHPLFFDHPFGMVSGCETETASNINSSTKLQTFYKNNPSFLKIAFKSICKIESNLSEWTTQFDVIMNQLEIFGEKASHTPIDTPRVDEEALQKTSPSISDLLTKMILNVNNIFKCYSQVLSIRADLISQQSTWSRITGSGPTQPNIAHFAPDDILAAFKAEKMIPQNFNLTAAESSLLKELFETYPLDSKLTLLDLLRFALIDRLENLRKNLPIPSRQKTKAQMWHNLLNDTQAQISAHSLTLCIRLYREKATIMGPVNEYSAKYGLSTDSFAEMLKSVLPTLRLSFDFIPETQKREAICTLMDETIIPIQKLWIKLLEIPGYYELMLCGLECYGGAGALDRESPEAATVLNKYWSSVVQGYNYGIKRRFFGVAPNFSKVGKFIQFSSVPKEKDMIEFGTAIAQELRALFQDANSANEALNQTVKGELSHKKWLENNQIKEVRSKSDLEFQEQLFSNRTVFRILTDFYTDILRIVEKRIFPQGTLTTQACFKRLIYNVFLETKQEEELSALHPFTHVQLTTVLAPIRAFLKSDSFKEVENFIQNDEDTSIGVFNHAHWLCFLDSIKADQTITPLFKTALQSLAPLPQVILDSLRQEWEGLTLEQLRVVDISSIKEDLFQEGLQALYPLLILSDMLALLQKRRYKEVASIIPIELAHIMELDGLDQLHKEIITAKTKAAKKALSPPPVVEEPKEITPPPAVDKPAETVKPPKIKAQQPAKQVAVAPAQTSSDTFDPREFAELTKQRQIAQRLRELGFFETTGGKGSHTKFKHPSGGKPIIVPRDVGARGTRHGLAEQVEAVFRKG